MGDTVGRPSRGAVFSEGTKFGTQVEDRELPLFRVLRANVKVFIFFIVILLVSFHLPTACR